MHGLHELITQPINRENWPAIFKAIKNYVHQYPTSVSEKNNAGFSALGMVTLLTVPSRYREQLENYFRQHHELDEQEQLLLDKLRRSHVFKKFERELHTLLAAIILSPATFQCLYRRLDQSFLWLME